MCSDFPRFYFVSAGELLEILFEEPKTVIKNGLHLEKVFNGITSVRLSEDWTKIVSLFSTET